jgi:bifunctional ADP-heptose synthase (sugar kinase/adenylyltransferase)
VGLVSLLGTVDSHAEFIREKLDPRIEASFLSMPGACTILKRRLVEYYPFQKLFEIYHMEPVVQEEVTHALLESLRTLLPTYDAVVVTDYGHGMLTAEVIDLICRQQCFLAVNTQTNAANQGFNTISKYPRADFICLSERELHLEARNRSRDTQSIVAETAQRLSCGRVIITQGRKGCLCYREGEGFHTIPSFTNRIVDRVGAGDALLAVTAPCAARGGPIELVGFIGNAVGAQAVEVVGNRSVVSRAALLALAESLLNFDYWYSTH